MDKVYRLNEFSKYLESRLSPRTINIYVDYLNRYFSFLREGKPNQESAQRFIDNLKGLAPNTVAIAAHSIIKWFAWRDKIEIKLDIPKIQQPDPEYVDLDTFKKLLDKCVSQLEKTILVVIFDTGIRISELIGLKVTDIHTKNKTITVKRKGGSVQDVNISDTALNELLLWVEKRPTSSINVFGDLSYMDAWKMFKDIGARLNIHLRPHMLRHARAIQMLEAGTPMYIVQQHLGHKNLSTTADIYGKFNTKDLRKHIPSWEGEK